MRILTFIALLVGGIVVLMAEALTAQSSTIRACVNSNSGGVRLVSADEACRPNEILETWSTEGPAGPAGARGPAGPAGPAGPGALMLVDSLGQTVGTITDPFQGTIVRKVGDDLVSLQPTTNGFTSNAINFFHTSTDCSGGRYLLNSNGIGFVYAAQVRGTTLFYTRIVDPSHTQTIAIGSYETLAAGQAPGDAGACTPFTARLPAAPVVTVTDATLATLLPPFHAK